MSDCVLSVCLMFIGLIVEESVAFGMSCSLWRIKMFLEIMCNIKQFCYFKITIIVTVQNIEVVDFFS